MATQTVTSLLQFCRDMPLPRRNFIKINESKMLSSGDTYLLRQRRSKPVNCEYGKRRFSDRRFSSLTPEVSSGDGGSVSKLDATLKKVVQVSLWITEGVYIVWLFLLPYAPGDPVWAISKQTVDSLIGLSLNFLFILPLSNSVGFHLIEAPFLHPVSEGLFNFVISWTLMFAPLLYSDKMRDKYKGSIDVLWGLQMFLTNTFLIPYMAVRMNDDGNAKSALKKTSKLGSFMTNRANVVGLVGGFGCLVSIYWALYGRGDGNFGDLVERKQFFVSYIGSERFSYAFIWDIFLYTIFQPWLIGDNLGNIQKDRVDLVNVVRFFPVAGLIAYCLFLDTDDDEL